MVSSDEVVFESEPKVARTADAYIVNAMTRYVHRKEPNDERLACGKPLPFKYTELQSLPADAKLCARCF